MQLACVLKRRNNPPLAVVSRGLDGTHSAPARAGTKRIANQISQPDFNSSLRNLRARALGAEAHAVGTFRRQSEQVLGFLSQGFDLEADRRRAFEAELEELIAPHMAVLVRRRAKLLADGEHGRWSDTLDCYMREEPLAACWAWIVTMPSATAHS